LACTSFAFGTGINGGAGAQRFKISFWTGIVCRDNRKTWFKPVPGDRLLIDRLREKTLRCQPNSQLPIGKTATAANHEQGCCGGATGYWIAFDKQTITA